MTVEFKVLNRGDDAILQHVAPDVFDGPVNPEYTREFLADPRHHIAVAVDHGIVVGFVSAVHYLHPDKPPELFINEVSVSQTHRRHGIAHSLLDKILQVARTHRCVSAWVLTYRTNTAAAALYQSAGATAGADTSGPPDQLVGFTFRL